MSVPAPTIHIKALERHYAMGDNVVRALDGVNLEIQPGEFVTIVGSSGSGKSTLMHLLGCLDSPSGGAYQFEGEDVSSWRDDRLSSLRNRKIGFVFQQFNLLSDLTVIENVALPLAYSGMGRDERQARATKYAEAMGLGDRLRHRPTELSGGQSQRVAIARALVNEPEVLFADEPTGNLDSATGREIVEILRDLNRKGLTIILVTHDPAIAEMGTRKVTMRDGKILEDRRIREVVAAPETKEETRKPVTSSRLRTVDLVRIGIKEGLLMHKTRTALTMLGIIIGVAAVISMSSLSLGSKRKQENQIRALGANLVRITDKRLEGKALMEARAKGTAGLAVKDLETLQSQIPEIRSIAAVREIKIHVRNGSQSISARVLGTSGDYLTVNNLQIAEGRFLDETDQQQSARVAVIGHAIREELGTDSPIGQELVMGGNPYTVVGVLANRQIDTRELEATDVNDANQDILIPLETLLHRTAFLDMRSELDEICFQLDNEDDLVNAGAAIRRILGITHCGVDDFDIVIPMQLLKQKQQSQRILDILTICISSIALIVGGIGIMNIMLASVTERVREIGIRRAVGATRSDIRRQFLSESVIISATGGLCGVLLAVLAVVIAGGLLAIPIVISPWMVVISVTAAMVTGLVFGLYPAIQAANKHPVEALRYE